MALMDCASLYRLSVAENTSILLCVTESISRGVSGQLFRTAMRYPLDALCTMQMAVLFPKLYFYFYGL